jgi:hypothetical protein
MFAGSRTDVGVKCILQDRAHLVCEQSLSMLVFWGNKAVSSYRHTSFTGLPRNYVQCVSKTQVIANFVSHK